MPITDLREAMKPGAPQVWPEAPGNIAVDWAGLAANPDEMAAKVDAAMKSAAHVARISLVHQRINVASMEPRGGTASYDAANDSYLLRVCSQGARAMRDSMAGVMGIPPAKIRVTTEEVGGAFGLKTGPYPEYIAMLVGAKKIGRPVFWMSGRNESFVSDNHARDAYSDVELALDDKGKFLALRIRHLGSMGAYIGAVGANIQTANMMRCLPGMYDIKLIDAQTKCVFTNTTPTAPYRGAGRPEASYCIERVVDEAARVTGIDPIRLRRKNLISKKAMPYKTAIGTTYDSGDFATRGRQGPGARRLRRLQGAQERSRRRRACCAASASASCWSTPAARRSRARRSSFPGGDKPDVHDERAVDRPEPRHDLPAHGRRAARHQGRAGRPRPRRFSAHEIAGYASVGSRTAMTAGHAMVKTLEAMLAKGKKVAAAALEAGEGDIEYKNGAFNVVGTDRRMSLFDVAARAKEMKKKGEIERGPRHQGGDRDAADVPERLPHRRGRGRSADRALDARRPIRRWTTAATSSTTPSWRARCTARSPWASARRCWSRPCTTTAASSVSASFMDYAMPRAHHLPMFKDDVYEVPATTNPLGVKGAGEAGTTAAIAAVMNAFADAIPGAGHKIQMPATPEKVWKACQEMAG